MDKETSWELRTRKLILAYWAAVPFMFIGLLMYIVLKDNVYNRTSYIISDSCVFAFFSANIIWLLKVPLISLKDNNLFISPLLFFRKTIKTELIASVSFKRRTALIRSSTGGSVRFPMSWLDTSGQAQLKSRLLEIVQSNQARVGPLEPER